MKLLKSPLYFGCSNLALISKIYIILIKTEPEERVRIMFMILVLLLTLASLLYVVIGIAKKIFSIFALITPIVVLCVGLLIAMNEQKSRGVTILQVVTFFVMLLMSKKTLKETFYIKSQEEILKNN